MNPTSKLTDSEAAGLLAELAHATDLSDLAPSAVHGVGKLLRLDEVSTVHRRKVSGRKFVDLRGADAAVEQLRRLPAEGETVHAITDGSYRGVDVIPAILKMADAVAVELIVSTLSFSTGNIDVLTALLDAKKIRRAALLCSVYFSRTSEQAYSYAVAELGKRGVTVRAARVHAKIILLRTNHGEHFVAEGSANLRSCLCVEQIALSRDASLYQWHRRWLRHVLKEPEPCD